MNSLDTISALSREFGTPVYVKAGGGNTSAKDASTLWIKPSGTTLKDLTPEKFVALDRAKLGELYRAAAPADPARREALVLEITSNGKSIYWNSTPVNDFVTPGQKGRVFLSLRLSDIELRHRGLMFSAFVWNPVKSRYIMDNFSVRVRSGNPVIYGFYRKTGLFDK